MEQMAKNILEDNKTYIGKDVAEQAILELTKQIENSRKAKGEEEKSNEKIKK